MNLNPVKAKKVHEAIEEQIMELIMNGQLRPGDRLPSERDLVDQLQVSRASVREALRSLSTLGHLEIKSGEGIFVKKMSIEDMINPHVLALTLDMKSCRSVYEVRRILEVGSVELAIQRATKEDMAKIADIIDEMRKSFEQVYNGDEYDIAFHYAIVAASHNPFLARLMDVISESIHNVVKGARQKIHLSYPAFGNLFEQHLGVFDAMRDKNIPLAKQRMEEHLLYSENLFTPR